LSQKKDTESGILSDPRAYILTPINNFIIDILGRVFYFPQVTIIYKRPPEVKTQQVLLAGSSDHLFLYDLNSYSSVIAPVSNIAFIPNIIPEKDTIVEPFKENKPTTTFGSADVLIISGLNNLIERIGALSLGADGGIKMPNLLELTTAIEDLTKQIKTGEVPSISLEKFESIIPILESIEKAIRFRNDQDNTLSRKNLEKFKTLSNKLAFLSLQFPGTQQLPENCTLKQTRVSFFFANDEALVKDESYIGNSIDIEILPDTIREALENIAKLRQTILGDLSYKDVNALELDLLLDEIQKYKDHLAYILVVGYASAVGSPSYNLDLSGKRAISVKVLLANAIKDILMRKIITTDVQRVADIDTKIAAAAMGQGGLIFKENPEAPRTRRVEVFFCS